MQEIQVVSNLNVIEYLIGFIVVLIGVVNILGMFILRGIKISIDTGEIKRQKDHDLLQIIATEQKLFHPESQVNIKS